VTDIKEEGQREKNEARKKDREKKRGIGGPGQ